MSDVSRVDNLVKPSILYVGGDIGTSRHRAAAFRRLGFNVCVIDPTAFFAHSRLIDAWVWRTGGAFLQSFIRRKICETIRDRQFDFVHVDTGELIGPSIVREMKSRFGTIINYNNDDPYGRRDGWRWRQYLRAVPFYDLIVVVRQCNVAEAYARGACKVLRVPMSADEVAHAPRPIREEDRRKWASDVLFIGTWMPERGPLFARLIDLGVPLSIYGSRWQKAPEWPILRSQWRGGELLGDDYAMAIQCAKVSLGLLSKGNRDLSTQRSFEIPLLGAVLCAERTSEHSDLYREGEEAVFWTSPEECASKCMQLLCHEEYRKEVAMNGRRRCLQNNTTNEAVLGKVLHIAGKSNVVVARSIQCTVLPTNLSYTDLFSKVGLDRC